MTAKRAQILSFDQVKRSGRTSAYAGRTVRQTSIPTYIDSSEAYSVRRRNSVVSKMERPTTRATRLINEAPSSSAEPARKGVLSGVKLPSFGKKTSSASRSARSSENSSRRANSSYRTASASATSSKTARAEKAENRKRARAKKLADKKFDKQFGALEEARNQAAAAMNGSRPALYKTQMGASQKKASRMQQAASATQSSGSKFAAISGAGVGAVAQKVSQSPKAMAGIAVAVCLVFACAFLYPTAQTYYQTVRENDRLQAEYSALQERNSQLETNVSSLQSDAGIEARARDQFGWVKKGETSVNVNGLNVASDTASSSATSLVASVDSSEIEAPSTWYSPMLDLIFGVS